jgi:GNAT superfamily N-acetyltransferase
MDTPPDLTPLQLMELHINTLYVIDSDGRLRSVNELGEPQPPRFYMGRTRHGNLWRFRHDLPTEVIAALDRLCRSEPTTADFTSPPQSQAAIRALLQAHAPIEGEDRGPAYWVAEDTQTTANVVLISEANAGLLGDGFAWLHPLLREPDLGPVAATIAQGQAVSLCFCSRRPNQATEAGVETLPAFRGQGYATAAVARWAAEVRRQGVIPLYSTSWENLASQSIARKLRMVFYGEDWSIL